MNTKINPLLYGLFFLLVIIGCRTSTEITAQWKADETTETEYQRVFVASLMDDLAARAEIEEEYASRLANRNVETIKSVDVFRPGFLDDTQPSKEQLLEIIQEQNVDGILTITLIDEKDEQRWVPGGGPGPMVAPMGRFGYYGTFPGYFDHWYGTGWNTGYYTQETKFLIETNLYDASSLDLIWSAQSKTYNTRNLASLATEYVDAIKKELREGKLIQ
jgi:hypothetical protein